MGKTYSINIFKSGYGSTDNLNLYLFSCENSPLSSDVDDKCPYTETK